MSEALAKAELHYQWVGHQPTTFKLKSALLYQCEDGLIELHVFWETGSSKTAIGTVVGTVNQASIYQEGYDSLAYDGIELAFYKCHPKGNLLMELGLVWPEEHVNDYQLVYTERLLCGHKFVWRSLNGAKFTTSTNLLKQGRNL